MDKKHKTPVIIAATCLIVVAVAYLSLPYYARQALIHLMPVINDLETFQRDTLKHDENNIWHWAHDIRYNTYRLSPEDEAYLKEMGTVSFLIIRHDSILYEKYLNGWNDTQTSNLFSATKTIIGLLAGIALDEGKIKNLDDKVRQYIPTYNKGKQAEVSIRNLLTMSGAMAWDEAYSSLFSVTTRGYYGNDLYQLVTNLDVKETPGVQYSYRSGETQLLSFVIESATGQSISQYAEEKLWKPLQAEGDAYWLLDKKDGDEKAFCCFHTTARDAARFGRLILDKGNWNGRQLISKEYMDEMTRPASYLKDQWGKDSLDYYGFQTWIMHYKGQTNPYMRGMLGQYVIAIPSLDAIVVRLGKKRSDIYEHELTTDIIRYMDIAMKILVY